MVTIRLRHFLILLATLVMVMGGLARAEDPPLPALTGRVIDRANILSDATEAALSARIEAHEQSTTNQIVIVTLPDLMGRPIEDWGLMLGRSWGIGQQGKNNGIVFLVAPNDRELRIEVGYGLEGDLTDATANAIIQSDVIPLFKRGDMEGGVRAGLEAILAVLSGAERVPAQTTASSDAIDWQNMAENLVPFAAVGCFFAISFLLSLRRRWDKKRRRYVWYVEASSRSGSRSGSYGSSSGRSGGGFSGGGGSFGGGGASGKW
ncbi:MAG: TPM domain-containing protein [Rhodospirillaceae bacterium]|nr:TPM domain-containing protein [Rhodospirillaceae bacterium]